MDASSVHKLQAAEDTESIRQMNRYCIHVLLDELVEIGRRQEEVFIHTKIKHLMLYINMTFFLSKAHNDKIQLLKLPLDMLDKVPENHIWKFPELWNIN